MALTIASRAYLLQEDHKKLLYPNCEDDQKKLGTTLELLQWKAKNGVTDKGFEDLLIMIIYHYQQVFKSLVSYTILRLPLQQFQRGTQLFLVIFTIWIQQFLVILL